MVFTMGDAAEGRVRFGVVAALVLAAYWPVLLRTYAFGDDYLLLFSAARKPSEMIGLELQNGRPIMLAVHLIAFQLADSVALMAVLRALAVVGLVAVAVAVADVARASGRRTWVSTGLGVAVVLTPACWIVAAWSLLFVVPPAMLAAMWAARRVEERGDWALPAVALTCACLTYQPAGMAYWVPIAVLLTGTRSAPRRGRAAAHARVLGTAGAATVAAWAFGLTVDRSGFENTRTPTTGPVEVGHWFVASALPRALVPFSLSSPPALTLAAAAFLLVGLYLATGRRIVRKLGLLALIPASYAPSLAASSAMYATARTMVGLAPVTLVLLVHAAEGINRAVKPRLPLAGTVIPRVVAIGVPLLLAAQAAITLELYVAKPLANEWEIAESATAAVPARTPITTSSAGKAVKVAPFRSYDEFGWPTTMFPWAPTYVVLVARQQVTGSWSGPRVEYAPFTDPTPPGHYRISFNELLPHGS